MEEEKNQVPLFKLVFTHNWEDPESDQAALKIKSGDTVFAITSGACNVLGFLLCDPKIIYSVDINPAQSRILELKIAAIRALDFEEFMAFSGIRKCSHRTALFDKIKPLLDSEAQAFWATRDKIIKDGFFMNGKYERFIRIAGQFMTLLQGKEKVRKLFIEKSRPDQELYYDQVWNTKRFHYLFKIIFNKRILARRGLVADYFHFDDGSKSFAESFYKRSKKAFRDIPIKGNYFLSLYLLGKYRNENELPAYFKKENYELIKSRVGCIRFNTAEAQTWLDHMPDESIDCFALSNICELMSEKDTRRLFTSVFRTGSKNARVIFRNLMIPRDVPNELKNCIVKDEILSRDIQFNDRSFVYGKVAAYNIIK
jgi:S-adenosylmethionine-diacylglycerol 3-amino-3-carboxypropyl transferase